MNSTVSVENPDEEEVIILESSRDASVDDVLEEIPLPPDESEVTPGSKILTHFKLHESGQNEDKPDADAASVRETRLSASPDTSQPLFKVIFRDETIARQYSEQIKEYLHNLVLSKSVPSAGSESCGLILEVWDDQISRKSQDTCTESEDSQDSECNLLFTIDTQPMPKDDLDIPTYGKKYEKAIQKTSSDLTEDSKEEYVQKFSCFNCSGNHNLRDCTEPRNQANINKNRKDFNAKTNGNAKRYHLEDSQRFGHLVPGQLSKDLRKALGLKDNQLPRHIYRMRILGYPPGWLEEARLQHSGLSLFNSDGVAERDPNEEPGEIIIDPSDQDQYDIRKIYDFPGFNVPPPPGTRDDYQYHWAPQMQAMHSKETMLSMLRCKEVEEGYKRKKLKVSGGLPTPPNSQTIPSDMDIEDVEECVVESVPVNGHFLPPLPKKSPSKLAERPLPLPPTTSEDSDSQSQEPLLSLSPTSPRNESTAPSSRGNSPSLSDLECMKKRLLVELEDSSSQSNPGTPTRSDASLRRNTNATTSAAELTPQTGCSQETSSALNTSRGSVKSMDLGTPLLHSASPYSKLPSSEKFSKNICDVINFENLPDSTGKYEQMTGIIQKVRDTLSKIHQQSQ